MSEFPISDEAVEVAAREYHDRESMCDWTTCTERDIYVKNQRFAIQAFLATEGFEVDDFNGHNTMQRLIGPWRPKS